MPWKDANTFETEEWHYIPAANNSGSRTGPVLGAVIHSAETSEGEDSAIGIGNWFKSGKTVGSTHAGVDGGSNEPSTVQYVWDSLIAHGAPGANHSHMHIEIAGVARQTRAQWLDSYSLKAIDRAANVVAQWALKFKFPLRWVSVAQLRRGVKGLCTHDDVSKAFGRSSHWDPGPNFPKDIFLAKAKDWYAYWLQQNPNYNPAKAEPDFKVVVLHDADHPVDEGMSLVYGDFNDLKVLQWPIEGISFETVFAVGAVANERGQISKYIKKAGYTPKVIPLTGADRKETAHSVASSMKHGVRKHPNVEY